ncbi:hypothetical protein DFH28DRAFT_1106520 [Melampsora americana]|nr:hypothetical protein DFH28DRAFT_1106520 [Melampsora americana]
MTTKVPGTTKPRLWCKPLSAAVYCYQQILKMIEELEACSLNLTALERLASHCPRCFGPAGACGIQKGPQFIVCVDGNFQNRQHESVSKETKEIQTLTPSLFMKPEDVAPWEPIPGDTTWCNVPLDPCTLQHTAAANCQDGLSWQGCKEIGLIGLACWHDHMLKLVNVIQSGEKVYFVHALIGLPFESILEARTQTNSGSVGVLYDIGCTMEKGVIRVPLHCTNTYIHSMQKNNIFADERMQNRLKFGTSAFHAYVHQWSRQLQYNPRLNAGWDS